MKNKFRFMLEFNSFVMKYYFFFPIRIEQSSIMGKNKSKKKKTEFFKIRRYILLIDWLTVQLSQKSCNCLAIWHRFKGNHSVHYALQSGQNTLNNVLKFAAIKHTLRCLSTICTDLSLNHKYSRFVCVFFPRCRTQ